MNPASFSNALQWIALLSTILFYASPSLHAQSREEATMTSAIEVFKAVDTLTLQGIPRELLRDAQGVAIIPNVIKGSFIIGARRGNGVLITRDDQGAWGAPLFTTLTGGNIGWQVGVQSTDVILVFKSRRSIEGIYSGKFTIGVDAAAAAGPVGRQAAAGTDSKLQAEIYSYSRSRGLFAGVSFDGSKLQIDPLANAEYYKPSQNTTQPSVNNASMTVPPSALELVRLLTAATSDSPNNSSAPTLTNNLNQKLTAPELHSADEAQTLRQQITTMAPQLFELLDPQWQQYLALPNELFLQENSHNIEALQKVLQRYETIATSPQYSNLAARQEFQTVYQLLKHYVALESQSGNSLVLPPPPENDPNTNPIR